MNWRERICSLGEVQLKSYNRLMAVAPFVIFSSLASAQVAFNDFSSDTYSATFGYNPLTGWTIGGASSAVGIFESANQFVSGATGTVSDLILATGLVSGTGNLDVSLVSDNSNTVGGTVLETWVTPESGSFSSYNPPTVLTGDGTASLVSGTTYWVMITTDGEANSNVWAAWDFNDAGVNGLDAYNTGSGWNYQAASLGAFKIDVTPTPEPASMAALALGIAGLVARKRRK